VSPSTTDVLRHILDELEYLDRASSRLDREGFLTDDDLRRAFVRSLEIVGEATKRLPAAVRSSAGTVDWRAMAGMRDRLIHGYFAVDYELVWDVVVNEVPELLRTVRSLLERLS
jgi:uncharacterized protein with HEPN domain